MTSEEFKTRLRERAERAGVALSESHESALEKYFRLLARWNSTINLTALPLDDPTSETIDRLFVEPLAALAYIEDRPQTWFDLGSGGGSPAIPLKTVRPELRLTMVESKTRKAAFLRDAIRLLALAETNVAESRFEELPTGSLAELITARAVRPDAALFATARRLLSSQGRLIIFHPRPEELSWKGFVRSSVDQKRVPTPFPIAVFHVEQSD